MILAVVLLYSISSMIKTHLENFKYIYFRYLDKRSGRLQSVIVTASHAMVMINEENKVTVVDRIVI